MTDHVYKHIELTGTSSTSIEDAIQNAVARASETIRHLRWFEVIGTRGYIDKSFVKQWQVSLKIGFSLEGED
ncbi:MAG: dodecin domain-containing protein [Candidatus Competibacteraceae bacterium]|nr:dodecin domain-containing protein [Candidatus Competibacteraceae bacterium]